MLLDWLFWVCYHYIARYYIMDIKDKLAPIRKGLLELVVLKIISHGQVYAADILAKLNQTEFGTQEGTLYPLLSRLRREGTVDYEWIESSAGPPRKYYRLTTAGQKQLKELLKYWGTLGLTIKKL
jgi:PadR family transcriptional regulator